MTEILKDPAEIEQEAVDEAEKASPKKPARKKGAQAGVHEVNAQMEAESSKILNSLVREIKESKWPQTHVGVIVDVRKGPEYDKTKERLLVILFEGGYVYMLEREAPDWVRSAKIKELKGREIAFKPFSISDGCIYVSNRFCVDMYRKAMEDEANLRGVITAVTPNENFDEAWMTVTSHGDKLVMARNDYSVFGTPPYLPALLNRKVTFRVIGIDDDGTVHVSTAILEGMARDRIIEEIEASEGVVAEITSIRDFGAYLVYKGIPLILRNKEFSTDYTPISMVKKKGDSLLVKINSISRTRRIFVEPVVKYTTPKELLTQDFESGQVIKGTVTGTSAFGLFARVAPGLDILCGYPENMKEPKRGDEVNVRIITVRKQEDENGVMRTRLRGKVVSVYPKGEEEKPEAKEKEEIKEEEAKEAE